MARNISVGELKQPVYEKVIDPLRPLFGIEFGCVHKGAAEHADHDWQKFCNYYKNFQENEQCFYIGMGDYVELVSKRERVALSNPDIHESTIEKWEQEAQESVEEIYEDIKFMEGRLLGLVEGNHFFEFSDGTTSTMRLCNMLRCPYLAGGLYGKLVLRDKKNRSRYYIDIYAAHTTGSTLTVSGSIMRGERFAGGVKANIYILGHDHQHIVADLPLVELGLTRDGKKVRTNEYKRCVLRAGSFYRAFHEGTKSYAIQRLYKPSGIGNAQVEIIFTANSEGERYFTISPTLKSW